MNHNMTQTAGEQPVSRKKRPRLLYLDIVRALAAILIVITHFNNPYFVNRPVFMYQPFGIYVGSLGVSLFLIISGAALMYTYGQSERLDMKRFYYKRFIGIYPMFWIAFILAQSYFFLAHFGHVLSSAPKWMLIFSVLGFDGYIANAGFPTFYLLGEWFLGFIILFYILFPLLRYGVKYHPIITAGIIGAFYVGTLIIQPNLHGMPQDLLITTRLPELVFGMYFIQYMHKVPHILAAFCVVFLAIQELSPILQGNIAVTCVGISAFLALVWVSQWINVAPVRTIANSLSKYSYAIFLVHHVVIVRTFELINPQTLSYASSYLMFVVLFMIIMALSVALYKLEKATVAYVRTCIGKA